jgi:hypothetical protein
MSRVTEFVNKNDAECLKRFKIDSAYLYRTYGNKIKPYFGLVTKYQNMDNPINEEEMRIILGVSHSVWKASKYYFSEFVDILSHKKDIMKSQSEMYLIRGLEGNQSNPKLIELALRMYNEDYKPKGAAIQIELPKTVTVVFEDASATEEELEEEYGVARK